MEKTYFTPDELAARFENRISLRTLENWRYHGKGPKFTKIGGVILYPVAAVTEWETARTVKATAAGKKL